MALDVLEQIQEQCCHDDLLQQEKVPEQQPQPQPQQQDGSLADVVVGPQQLQEVDAFLREALNSRNRITVLRLEQEIERFSRNQTQQDLLLKPMQSSYERLAAHRIAQHYGLQSMVVSALFPKVSRILLVKTPDSKLPSIKLADLPFEGSALEKSAFTTNEKIAIKQRESRDTGGMGLNGSSESGRLTPKTMEEREVEYDRARARIFNSADAATETHGDTGASDEVDRQKVVESSLQGKVASPGSEGKIQNINTNRVAIFRDREKDMKDPDYDRSYRRYLQPLEQAGVVFPSLHRVYPPINAYDKYTRFDGPWGHQLQVDQSSYVPPLHVRGPRVETCYPDLSYLPHGQGHSDAYWQCQRFPPHFGHYAQLKNGFPYSCQHGLQSSTSLGALGR